MPRVSFTSHLRKHQPCEPLEVAGATVTEALEHVFEQIPDLRGYILDDQGRVRQHVMIFVDDAPLKDRTKLADKVGSGSQIYVMQALSGG